MMVGQEPSHRRAVLIVRQLEDPMHTFTIAAPPRVGLEGYQLEANCTGASQSVNWMW